MFSPRWSKVVRDLTGNKTRTLLVVLSISVGVFAVGTIANSQTILTHDLAERYAAINPASATLALDKPFDDELVEVIRRTEGVKEAEGRAVHVARIKKTGGEDGYPLQLIALDYGDNRPNKIRSDIGAYPPPRREIVLKRTSLDFMGAHVGDAVEIEMPSSLHRMLRVAGTVRDLTIVPPVYFAPIVGYIGMDTLDWLGAPGSYNQLLFAVADTHDAGDRVAIQRIAEVIRDRRTSASGSDVMMTDIPVSPGQPPLAFVINAMLLVLGALSVLVLLPTGFLVLTTISFAYVNLPYFAQVMRHPFSANSLRVVTERHDPAGETAVMYALEAALKQSGVRVSSTEATAELIERITTGMSVLVIFLLLLAVMLALVGGLGLMGTLSLNVLERTREIGVLRAIGASKRAVMQTILAEAVAIGLASWVGAVPLSYPLSRVLSDQVGFQLFQSPLSFSFASEAIGIWLVVVLFLSALAGFLPARRASRLTVREVLAYE